MPTLHWCNKAGQWFRTRCPNRDDEPGIQWSTFVHEDFYDTQTNNTRECECAVKERLALKPMNRRLP